MHPNFEEIAATVCFALALIHTFSVSYFRRAAERFPRGSVVESVLHGMGEVEVVFGLWAGVYLLILTGVTGFMPAAEFLKTLSFTEPLFVFAILALCATRPILWLATKIIERVSQALPLAPPLAFYSTALVIGPLLGSLITEPAAMTVTAMILLERFYRQGLSERLMYTTAGLLFVNVSVGGVLTPFAAPPVLMVAAPWGWDFEFMITQFGWRGALSCFLSTALVTFVFRKEIAGMTSAPAHPDNRALPSWVTLVHVLFLAGVVYAAHYPVICLGLLAVLLGFMRATKDFQNPLKLREATLVAFFLAGLVVLGARQRWWLEPLITNLEADALFWGAMALTAITDNAALTYLGAQVPGLSDVAKIALVGGAVVGGGLTVIANAPNPAGYGILNPAFPDGGIRAFKLFLGALPPTLIAAVCFWLL